MMMIGSDDRGRVKIVLYGINSKTADVSLTSLLLAVPQMFIYNKKTKARQREYARRNIYNEQKHLFRSTYKMGSHADTHTK